MFASALSFSWSSAFSSQHPRVVQWESTEPPFPLSPFGKHLWGWSTATCSSSICSSYSHASKSSSSTPASLRLLPPSWLFQLYWIDSLAFSLTNSSSERYVWLRAMVPACLFFLRSETGWWPTYLMIDFASPFDRIWTHRIQELFISVASFDWARWEAMSFKMGLWRSLKYLWYMNDWLVSFQFGDIFWEVCRGGCRECCSFCASLDLGSRGLPGRLCDIWTMSSIKLIITNFYSMAWMSFC